MALLLTACGPFDSSAAGDPVKCEAKMRTAFEARMGEVLAGQSPTAAAKPAECEGLTDEQLAEIGTRLLSDSTPSPTP